MNSTLVSLACSAVLAGLTCAGLAALKLSNPLGWTALALVGAGLTGLLFLFT